MVPQLVVISIPQYHALLQDVTVTKKLPAAPLAFLIWSASSPRGSAPGILQSKAGMKQSHRSWVGFVWLLFLVGVLKRFKYSQNEQLAGNNEV